MKRMCEANDNGYEGKHLSSKKTNCARVYLDYNATTPLDDEVLLSISSALRDAWGNPSSSYYEGQKARLLIEEARANIATMVKGSSYDVIFTSGGTEANNTVFHTAIEEFALMSEGYSIKPHFITSNIEHDSVLYPLKHLEKIGKADVTIVPVSKISGQVEPELVAAAVTEQTCLISIMMANNETGNIQPIAEISNIIKKKINVNSRKFPVKIHSDIAQCIGKIDVDVNYLGVDYLTIVGHKFYGPRIGALYVKDLKINNAFHPIFYGGGQENGLRPGTENTGMIAGLGKAAFLACEHLSENQKTMLETRDYLESSLMEIFGSQNLSFNGKYKDSERLPNTCNFSFRKKGLEGYKLMELMPFVQASTGAACHSNSLKRCSSVLLAFGISEDIATNALRISVGKFTKKADIDLFIEYLKSAVSDIFTETPQTNTDLSVLIKKLTNNDLYYKSLLDNGFKSL